MCVVAIIFTIFTNGFAKVPVGKSANQSPLQHKRIIDAKCQRGYELVDGKCRKKFD